MSEGMVSMTLEKKPDSDYLLSASLIFPELSRESPDMVCGGACATLLLFLLLGKDAKLPPWLAHGKSQFLQHGVYEDKHKDFLIRLSATDNMYHLTVLFA